MNNKELKAETEAQQSENAALLPSAPLVANPMLAAVVCQLKDVPDKLIIEFLYKRHLEGKIWCCWFDGYENSIGQAMPQNTPEKIKIKKMAKLINRGLVSGCSCGCRGDYEITEKGIEWLSVQ